MFELIDEAFYQMTLAVEMLILFPVLFAIRTRGNDCRRGLGLNLRDEGVGIIAVIGQHKLTSNAFDQGWALDNVVDLSRC